MIEDGRGKMPNFVIAGGELRHQPTGLAVELPAPATPAAIRAAQTKLKALVEEAQA